ncbi:MAG: hypothetical protein IRZ09_13600 [Variibacter sp.]|nr:hypothetical protein [Variibacter sp.]
MRIVSTVAAAAAFVAAYAVSEAEAARWCAYNSYGVLGCGFRSAQECKRTVGRQGVCRREVAYRHAAPFDPDRLPGQIYPSRPYWAAPGECFLDDGYGRFRPCSGGGDGGGGMR